jgi:threonine/homoserine/homoserine lactone efflux protein
LLSIPALAAASPVLAPVLAIAVTGYLVLLAVAALTATLHPHRHRRADARRVLSALLTVLVRRRRR